ncbi:TniB family NTP-binding protein [Paeniglutamicibacter kerguelensis]|uniref:AAA family ATPase n=1 Tax=Paeniglutamicibacter kerguelensis TaxID=254788 RepID=A0ABS4XCZ8_9MICC|nr:TniB family NTP-binding protein [Paeniglutamicibacter kerguelensis]MBP2386340.1 hypothetical protein [Paeniglutamicibacter kerguelensis]
MDDDLLAAYRKPIEEDLTLMKWESLNRILGTDRTRFRMLHRDQYLALDEVDRFEFNAERLRFMAGGMTIKTEMVTDLIKKYTVAELMNSGSLVGNRGIMLSAPASSGKSTACLALIQHYLALYERHNPGAISGGAVPAMYISIPATRTIKGTLQRMCRYLAIPFKKSDTETDLSAMLLENLARLGTKLIVLDEVQMLKGAESVYRPAVNNLKDLTNYFRGTIVYSGLNLTESGLLYGDAGLQLGSRVFTVKVTNLAGRLTDTSVDEWIHIVSCFARELPLFANESDSLIQHARWLHSFTGGNIGTLKAVLFDSCASLILADKPTQETVTIELLQEGVRDYAAVVGASEMKKPAPLAGARNRARAVRNAS